MAKEKQFLLIITEGPTDKLALNNVVKTLIAPYDLGFQTHHDITSVTGITISNIIMNVTGVAETGISRLHLKPQDIFLIAHLMDTDGAYVTDTSRMEQNPALDHFEYTRDTILACSTQEIINRNQQKKANMSKLSGLTSLTIKRRKIPYMPLFCSRNLEDALSGIDTSNLSSKAKWKIAMDFDKKYKGCPQNFIRDMASIDPIDATKPFPVLLKESWENISAPGSLASLARHTNLHLFLDRFSEIHKAIQENRSWA